MNTLLIAVFSIALSVLAQFSLRAGMSSASVQEAMVQPFAPRSVVAIFSNWYVLGGFLLYGLGAILWLGVLSKWEVSKAYPLVGLGFILTAIIGLALGEHVTPQRAGGVALICLGVILVSRS